MSNLTELQLRGSFDISESLPATLITNSRSLRKLALECCVIGENQFQLEHGSLEELEWELIGPSIGVLKCPKLQILYLHQEEIAPLSDGLRTKLACPLPVLKHLYVTNVHFISVDDLLKASPGLQEFHILAGGGRRIPDTFEFTTARQILSRLVVSNAALRTLTVGSNIFLDSSDGALEWQAGEALKHLTVLKFNRGVEFEAFPEKIKQLDCILRLSPKLTEVTIQGGICVCGDLLSRALTDNLLSFLELQRKYPQVVFDFDIDDC
jgi:hypothetical protein